jgi:chromosomal replication initiator protein
MEQLESRLMARLREQISPRSFDTWFRGVKLLSLRRDELELGVPNNFWADWLKSNFLSPLKEIIGQLTGREVRLKFTVDHGLQPDKTQSLKGRLWEGSAGEAASSSPGQPVASGVNSKYTFDSFVVGASNQFAHAAAVAVAESPAKAYNPLFLYGGVGLGKTHLLHAIGNLALVSDACRKVCYLSSEEFMNELINSIRFDKMSRFREKYRSCGILLIDDIQFISGKERTQEEFFHTFNSLHQSRGQIVVSSDRFPREIAGLEERLRSRFEWGLIADIQPPEMETRTAILKKKAQLEKIPLPNEVAFFLASSIESNIRELEGALIRLGAFSSLTGRPITLELVKEVLKDIIFSDGRSVSITSIQKAVANFYGIKVTDLTSTRRLKNIAGPRQVAMYLTRRLTQISFPGIGREFGNKDHSTVIHAVRKVEERMKHSGKLREEIQTLKKAIPFSA